MNRKDLEGKLILLMHLRRIRRKKAIQEKEKKVLSQKDFSNQGGFGRIPSNLPSTKTWKSRIFFQVNSLLLTIIALVKRSFLSCVIICHQRHCQQNIWTSFLNISFCFYFILYFIIIYLILCIIILSRTKAIIMPEYFKYIGTYECHWTDMSAFFPLLHLILQNKTPNLENV